MEATNGDKLNSAILRLSAELRLDKISKQYQVENEKLLWECHKAELEYIEQLTKYRQLLEDAENKQTTALFLEQLQNAKRKLQDDGSQQVNLEVVQKLVHQLQGRSQDFHINVTRLKGDDLFAKMDAGAEAVLASQEEVFNETIVQELNEFNSRTEELRCTINQLQNNICATSDDAIRVTADLIHDVISQ